jgi:hypothetical protein
MIKLEYYNNILWEKCQWFKKKLKKYMILWENKYNKQKNNYNI